MGLFDGPGDREGTQGSGGAFSGGVRESGPSTTYSSLAAGQNVGYSFPGGGGDDSGDGPADVQQPMPQPSPQPYTPGITFRGMGPAGSGITLRTGSGGQIYGVVDKRVSPDGYQSPTYGQAFADKIYRGSDQTNFRGERMPTPSEQIMQMRQQATQNPRNIFGEEGFSYDYKTTAPGEALPRRTYGDTVMLNGQEVDLVTGYSEPSVGDIVATTLGSMGLGGLPVGLLGGKETYIAGEEPANLQQQPGLAGLFAKAVTGATPEQLASKGAGMADRLQSFFKGPSEKATTPQATNIGGPPGYEENVGNPNFMADSGREMYFTLEGSNLPENQQFNRDMAELAADEGEPIYSSTYDAIMPQTVNVSGPTSIPESIAIARANEGSAMGPYQTVDIATPTPRPARNAPNFGMAPTQEEVGFVQFPELANAPNVGLSPSRPEDTFTIQDIFPELRNAPNVGYDRDFGPRTADDLRSMGIEPSMQDLQDMNLSPAEFLQESQRLRENQPVRQANDMSVAQIVPGTAFERATGVNLPRGRSVDLETMQVIRDSDGRIEGDVRALMRKKGMTFQELISLPGLRSSFAPDNTTG